MLLRLAIAFLTLSVSTVAQSYSGYVTPGGQTQTPLVSYAANARLTCSAAYSSNPTSYPAGCTISSWTLSLNQSVVAPSAGTAYLYCDGQAYLSCTLSVVNPGGPTNPAPRPTPKPDPFEGSGWIGLGGGNQHRDGCDRQGMIVGFPSTVTAAVSYQATFNTHNLGGGFCSTTSGGDVNWGDGSPTENFPGTVLAQDDACAKQGTVRLAAGPYLLSHTYTDIGTFTIFVHTQGDFKDNGDPGGHTKIDSGNSGSWRCIEQKHQTVNVVAPVPPTSTEHVLCRVKAKLASCPTSGAATKKPKP